MKAQLLSHVELRFAAKSIAPAPSRSSRLVQQLQALGAAIVHSLTDRGPQIRLVSDRSGFEQWRVYDPVDQRSLWFGSEDEVRQWLDSRYAS